MIKFIVSYFLVIINFLVCTLLYKIITSDKIYINIKNILLIIFFSFISLIISYLNSVILNIASNIFFILFLIKIFYKINIKKSFYYSIIISIIFLFSDALVSIIINNNYLLNFELFIKNYFLRSLLIIPVCIISILFCNIPIIKKNINLFYEKLISKYNKNVRLYVLLVITIIMLSFCLNAYNRVDRFNHSITILGIFCFTLIFIFTLYLLYHEYQIEQCNKKIIEENNYIKSIAKKDEEFKHNLINNLLGIKTVSNSKTNKLIDELISDYQKDYKNITNINDLPNGVQSIIYRKAYEDVIEGLNLIVTNNIKNELYDLISPKKYNNLCTAIGILFDNALEAVKNTPEKIIEINFCEDVQKIYFVIKNTFSNVMDLEETGKKNFTTKKTGHGIGLNYLKNLKTLELENKIINDIFIIKLSIKKNKKI